MKEKEDEKQPTDKDGKRMRMTIGVNFIELLMSLPIDGHE
jgi:hypothetical protein